MTNRRSTPSPVHRARAARGFTLLEILFALAIASMVLIALNTLIFSMGELWGRNSDVRLFEQHTRAVTRYLERELRGATLPPFAQTGATPIVPQEIRPQNGSTENLLTFELTEGSRLIPWPERPLPEVVCSLQARERSGLWLLWHSRLEKKFEDDPPHETLVSPYVSALSYDYYDTEFKNWKNENVLRRNSDNKLEVPQRLRLKFTYGKMTRETVIVLSNATEGLPNF